MFTLPPCPLAFPATPLTVRRGGGTTCGMETFLLIASLLVAGFAAGVLVEKKNGLVARAQKGEQAALDAIKAKLNLK